MRRAGFTLIEMAAALGVLCLLMGSITVAFSRMTTAAVSTERHLSVVSESGKGLHRMLEELQVTNSLGVDDLGRPYLEIEDNGEQLAGRLRFRKVVGFNVDPGADAVEAIYSTVIEYYVNEHRQLVRQQDGDVGVIANRVESVRFARTPSGNLVLELATIRGQCEEPDCVKNQGQIVITPRNSFRT